ncbi:MAG: UbiA family prenyltransferase [Candidatus Bathyarchaeota archaeon]|nr:UbiA family prenyltransferase [Candidatus Bathyarchaeota archaeon]
MTASAAKGVLALLRIPYWMMTGGLALLTAFAINKNFLSVEVALLSFFSMAFITSAGFALNDYFDRESDAVIKPKRPIPSGALSLKQVVAIAVLFLVMGLGFAALINKFCLIILLVDSILLVIYSAFIKRKSGFAANILIGILTGTAFLYGEAVTLGADVIMPTSLLLASLSLYPIAFGTIGGNILRDVLSLEGDAKVGYPTLPQKIGIANAVRVAVVFFLITSVSAPLPYLLGQFTVYYLPLMLIWSILLVYASIRLVASASAVENVRKYERLITMSMILLPLSLIIEALSPVIGGFL